ncbi:MAG TPA: histidinol-phosphate transaminase [Polyangia bacterium]|nr:histidinol-phosphate transaminase [Polyangia bacterium]
MVNDDAATGKGRKADVLDYVRPGIRALHGYTPGEQHPGFTKLNTNESAIGPAPGVLAVLAGIADESLRLYPDPTAVKLRQVAAERFGLSPEQILVGNGSDDCLTILYRTFLDPGARVAFAWPSYGLYDTLAGLQGAQVTRVSYERTKTGWTLPAGLATTGARMTMVANPDNPSSTLAPVATLRQLAEQLDGILVVDEAYIDFALGVNPDASFLPYLAQHPNVVVLRTFSKSYSLAGARLGLMFAAPALIEQMNKVKDSYNVNVITQALGVAALQDRAHHADLIRRTLSEKARVEQALAGFGWTWPAAFGNFVLVEVGARAREVRDALKAHKILVRFWDTPELRTFVRITIGSPAQNDALLAALRAIV